jgi:protein-L-isoaspartate(D-aspartate) O-methyltransferase
VLAKLIQALDIKSIDHVLDVGAATGYGAALLSRLAGSVVALEQDPALAAAAKNILAELKVGNVAVALGPLAEGATGPQPFDAILIEGAIERVPDALKSQLKDGGRLAAVVGSGTLGRARLFTRVGEDFSVRPLFDAGISPLPGFAAPRAFVF